MGEGEGEKERKREENCKQVSKARFYCELVFNKTFPEIHRITDTGRMPQILPYSGQMVLMCYSILSHGN